MQITLASQPGTPGAVNLDWAGAAACGTAVVLDGLTESADTGCLHGTAWYVNALGTRLLAAAADPAYTLVEALALALSGVADAHRDSCDLTHPGTPGATVAVVRPRAAVPATASPGPVDGHGPGDDGAAPSTALEYLVLSDAIVVLDTGQDPVVVTDRRVDAHLADLSAAAAGAPAAVPRLIEAQQGLRNSPGGYWVARADADAAGHSLTGAAAGVRAALLLTDGAAVLASVFGAVSWQEITDLALDRGPAAVIAATREIEARDADRAVWPRYKTHDDATAVLCDLRPSPFRCS
jgi:hypothetical protein